MLPDPVLLTLGWLLAITLAVALACLLIVRRASGRQNEERQHVERLLRGMRVADERRGKLDPRRFLIRH